MFLTLGLRLQLNAITPAGAWLGANKPVVTKDLASMAARQATEKSAYGALSGTGLTPAHLNALAVAARNEAGAAVAPLAHDPGGHPGWVSGLKGWLNVLAPTATAAAAKLKSAAAVVRAAKPAAMPAAMKAEAAAQAAVTSLAAKTLAAAKAAAARVTAARAKMAGAQAGTVRDQAGLAAAFKPDLAAVTPDLTWTVKNKTAVQHDLVSLAAKQAAEKSAYASLGGTGLTAAHLNSLAAAAKSEAAAGLPALLSANPGGHPGWVSGLKDWLNSLASGAAATAAGKKGGGGTGPPTVSAGSTGGSSGATIGSSTDTGVSSPADTSTSSTTTPVTVTSITNPLTAEIPLITSAFTSFLNDLNAFAADITTIAPGVTSASYPGGVTAAAGSLGRITAVYGGGNGVLSDDMDRILGDITSAASQPITTTLSDGTTTTTANPLAAEISPVASEFSSFLAKVNAALAGGAPGASGGTGAISADMAALLADLRAGSAPALAGGGVIGSYDKGGYLPPGMSMAWNGTGRPEPVGAAAGPQTISLEISGNGSGTFDAFLLQWIKKNVRVRGGGSAQKAFGNHEIQM